MSPDVEEYLLNGLARWAEEIRPTGPDVPGTLERGVDWAPVGVWAQQAEADRELLLAALPDSVRHPVEQADRLLRALPTHYQLLSKRFPASFPMPASAAWARYREALFALARSPQSVSPWAPAGILDLWTPLAWTGRGDRPIRKLFGEPDARQAVARWLSREDGRGWLGPARLTVGGTRNAGKSALLLVAAVDHWERGGTALLLRDGAAWPLPSLTDQLLAALPYAASPVLLCDGRPSRDIASNVRFVQVEDRKRRASDLTLTGWSPGAAAAWKQRWESLGGAPLVQAALPRGDEALPGEWVLSAKVGSELGPHAEPQAYASARLDEACKSRRDPAAWRRLAQRVAWVQTVSDRPVRPWWPTPEGVEGYPFAPDDAGLWIEDNTLLDHLRSQHLHGVLSSTAARRLDDLSEYGFWLDGDGVCALYAETFGLGLPEYAVLEDVLRDHPFADDLAARARQLRVGVERGTGWAAIQGVAERIGMQPAVVLDRVRLATFAVAAASVGWNQEDDVEDAQTLSQRCGWPLGEALRAAQIGDLYGADLDFLAPPSNVQGALERCDLSFADFSQTRFLDARLVLCDLEGASFDGGTLEETTFVLCNLAGADFRGARLVGVTFEQCAGLEGATWDDITGLVPWESYLGPEGSLPPDGARYAWSAASGRVEVYVPPGH